MWANQAFALGKLGRDQEALEAADEAIRLDPEHVFAWKQRGFCSADWAAIRRRSPRSRRRPSFDPVDAWAWANRAFALGRLGRDQEALEAADKAIELTPSTRTRGCSAVLRSAD